VVEDEVVGGAIPREFIGAVEDGIIEAAQTGVLGGYPMVDIKIQIIDGTTTSPMLLLGGDGFDVHDRLQA